MPPFAVPIRMRVSGHSSQKALGTLALPTKRTAGPSARYLMSSDDRRCLFPGRMGEYRACRSSAHCQDLFSALGGICLYRRSVHELAFRRCRSFTCHPDRERYSICTLPPNSANANCAATHSPIGTGGIIAIGPPTSPTSIPSRTIRFCPHRFANTRLGVRVFVLRSGVCVLNSQPWEPTSRRNRSYSSHRTPPTNQLLAGFSSA